MKLKDFITTVLVDVEQGINGVAMQTNRRTFLHNRNHLNTNATVSASDEVYRLARNYINSYDQTNSISSLI